MKSQMSTLRNNLLKWAKVYSVYKNEYIPDVMPDRVSLCVAYSSESGMVEISFTKVNSKYIKTNEKTSYLYFADNNIHGGYNDLGILVDRKGLILSTVYRDSEGIFKEDSTRPCYTGIKVKVIK